MIRYYQGETSLRGDCLRRVSDFIYDIILDVLNRIVFETLWGQMHNYYEEHTKLCNFNNGEIIDSWRSQTK